MSLTIVIEKNSRRFLRCEERDRDGRVVRQRTDATIVEEETRSVVTASSNTLWFFAEAVGDVNDLLSETLRAALMKQRWSKIEVRQQGQMKPNDIGNRDSVVFLYKPTARVSDNIVAYCAKYRELWKERFVLLVIFNNDVNRLQRESMVSALKRGLPERKIVTFAVTLSMKAPYERLVLTDTDASKLLEMALSTEDNVATYAMCVQCAHKVAKYSCSACTAPNAAYCSRKCQSEHWLNGHQDECIA
jgi:hypothetical protein